MLRFSFLVNDQKLFERYFSNCFDLDIWFKSPFEGRYSNFHEIFYKKGSCINAEFASKHIVNFPTHERIPYIFMKIFLDKNINYIKNQLYDSNFKKTF